MLKSTRRNSGKVRNRMHPNEARMQEDYYSSAVIIANQQEESEMASLSIQSKSQEEITMNEQATQQDQATPTEVTETVTKPSNRRALPARQAKQQEVIITPPPTDILVRGKSDDVDAENFVVPVNEGYTDSLRDPVLDHVNDQVTTVTERGEGEPEITITLIPQEDVDLVLEPTTLDEPEVPVVPEVRKRTIPETRGARQSMLPPKVEPTVKVVSEVPAGYVDAGDRYERKVEASLLGVTASVTMTKPKPSSAGLIFEGRIDLEEAEGVQFWRPIFNRKVTPDDHVPAHCVPVIVRAAQYRNAGLFDPVFLIAIPCTVGDMNDPNVEVSSGEDGTVITFKTE